MTWFEELRRPPQPHAYSFYFTGGWQKGISTYSQYDLHTMLIWPSEMKLILTSYFKGSYALEIMPSLVILHTATDKPTEMEIKSLFF